MKLNTAALYRAQQSRLSRLTMKAKVKPVRSGSEVVNPTGRPQFYGTRNVSKLPNPARLAAAMHNATAGISAESTLRHVDFSK